MKALWREHQWVIYVTGLIFSAGVAYATVGNIDDRLLKLENAFITVPASLARIEQKVDDIRK